MVLLMRYILATPLKWNKIHLKLLSKIIILNIKVKSTSLPSFAFLCSSLSFCNDFSNLDLCSYTTEKTKFVHNSF